MFQRDTGRFRDSYRRTDVLPLGSGALAGVPYPTDRDFLARELGFSRISSNSMDAVSDRDFLVEFLAAASICMMHFSRLSEEMVLWSSREFGFIRLAEEFTTGSSIMPQKRNPDYAELARGKTGRVYGGLMGLLTTLKGLPLTYNRDLQEDKEGSSMPPIPVGNPRCLPADAAGLGTGRGAGEGPFGRKPDVGNRFSRPPGGQGVPFREAHGIVRELCRHCDAEGLG